MTRESRFGLGLVASLLIGLTAPEMQAQDAEEPTVYVSTGLTLQSRFIYRGIDLGDAPQVQPRLSLHVRNLEVSLWASHPIAPSADDSEEDPRRNIPETYREVLMWARYDVDLGVGTLSPYVQNHYNPNAGALFDFGDGGRGAHKIQAQLMFTGKEGLPLDLMVGYVFYNDPGKSVYLEGGYRFNIDGVGLRLFAGGTPDKSPFNGAGEAALTVVGVSAGRTLTITDSFVLPVGFTFVFNPYREKAYASFSISL